MSKSNNGGPAFPSEIEMSDGTYWHEQGMTLRDWFAGQAIRAQWGNGQAMTAEQAAEFAYQLADAMLEAREKELKGE
jgi:hypothetical protein